VDLKVRPVEELDLISAAELILRKYSARAITLLTSARQMQDGRWITTRLSANDCYVALDEACRKTARVALRKYKQNSAGDGPGFEDSLDGIFPDPVAYLARAIKSVVSDEGRITRREIPTLSLEQPLGSGDEGSPLHLGDTVSETRSWKLPEASLIERDERKDFRSALGTALKGIPANYLEALISPGSASGRPVIRFRRRRIASGRQYAAPEPPWRRS